MTTLISIISPVTLSLFYLMSIDSALGFNNQLITILASHGETCTQLVEEIISAIGLRTTPKVNKVISVRLTPIFWLIERKMQSLSFDAFEWWLSYFVDLFEAYEQVKSTTLSQPLISVVMRAVMRMYFVDTFTETEEIVVPDSELDNIDFILNMINRHKVTRQLDENIINV